MKYKAIIAGMIFFFSAATIICGCGEKKINYEVGKKDKTESESSSLDELKKAEKWEEQLTAPARDAMGELNEEQKLSINAEIVVPDVKSMSVIAVEKTVMDEAFRKQFLKSYLGNGEIYYHDKAHYTKEELEKNIADSEKAQAQYEKHIEELEDASSEIPDAVNSMKETLQEAKEQWKEWKELLPNASDTYTVATEFGSCNEYIGQLGELFCHVIFDESSVAARPSGKEYYGPETLREYDAVSQVEKSGKGDENTLNECKLSMSDAKNLADAFLKNIGRTNPVLIEEKNLIWHGENMDENGNATEETYAFYGYSFTYGIGIDGINVANPAILPSYEYYDPYYFESLNFLRAEDSVNGDYIKITVTDEGVTEVSLRAPMDIQSVTKQVKLLPLDTIKEIIKNEITEHPENYIFSFDNSFNRMELLYVNFKDSTSEGTFSYVPTWCLSSYTGDGVIHPIFVNAIDGSIGYMGFDDFFVYFDL